MQDVVEKALDAQVMDEELNLGDFLLDAFPVVGYGLEESSVRPVVTV